MAIARVLGNLPRILQLLDRTTTSYLKNQIESGDSQRTKIALQQLCKHYRSGYRIHPNQLVGVEQSIVGLLYTQGRDEKVRRWALNALARLGREPNCAEAIMHTLKQFSHDPQTSAAAIAAIYRMSRTASELLRKLSFDEQMVTLAALQHVDSNRLDLSALPLNVETASADLLKLGLVVVGLNRAPANMFHPRHEYPEIVRVLGGHHDTIVSQYSVWAITENNTLGLADLGIDVRNIEQLPTNVRAWVLRLIAMTPEDAERNFEYLELGSRDPSAEARTGLAVGLRDTYFDGLDAFMLDWFTSEPDADVRSYLIDHMIRQAVQSPNCQEMVVDLYEKEPPGSALRERMEATAAGTAMYAKFKQVDQSADLFKGMSVTNNTYNISGGIQGGAISVGGTASNDGAVSVHYAPRTVEEIQRELSKAERELHQIGVGEDIKKEALEAVEAAKAETSPAKVDRAIKALERVETVAGKAAAIGTSIGTIASAIGKLAGLG